MKKYHIGYTSGTYDLFHIGHLNILRNAKGLCDHLIVGVSTDSLIRKYKKKEPTIPFRERIAIVESIKYVDAVVVQQDLDKYEAWKRLKYDILFIGDDWFNKEKWNEYEKKLKREGVKIVYFPYTKGISSALLRKKI